MVELPEQAYILAPTFTAYRNVVEASDSMNCQGSRQFSGSSYNNWLLSWRCWLVSKFIGWLRILYFIREAEPVPQYYWIDNKFKIQWSSVYTFCRPSIKLQQQSNFHFLYNLNKSSNEDEISVFNVTVNYYTVS